MITLIPKIKDIKNVNNNYILNFKEVDYYSNLILVKKDETNDKKILLYKNNKFNKEQYNININKYNFFFYLINKKKSIVILHIPLVYSSNYIIENINIFNYKNTNNFIYNFRKYVDIYRNIQVTYINKNNIHQHNKEIDDPDILVFSIYVKELLVFNKNYLDNKYNYPKLTKLNSFYSNFNLIWNITNNTYYINYLSYDNNIDNMYELEHIPLIFINNENTFNYSFMNSQSVLKEIFINKPIPKYQSLLSSII